MKANILVVDDNQSILTGIKVVIENKLIGAKVTCAASGKEALEIMRRQKPDLLLLDIMMPEMNGWDVAAEMKSDRNLKSVPILYVTAKADDLSKEMGMLSAEGFITKPFDGDQLLKTMKDIMSRASTEKTEP